MDSGQKGRGAAEGPKAKIGVKAKMKTTFSAMKHRNYRLWFWGQLISMFGSWMQLTALGFLVYQLTSSATYLGLVGFAAGVPYWFFTLYGGVISDRVSRKKIMLMTQSAMMVLAFILAALTFSGVIQPWHILLLAFLNGVANAFDAPARHSLVLDMVPREDLTNAIVMNGTMYNTSTILGPALGGLLYAIIGPAWCFMINGVSYLAIIFGLLVMRLPPFIRKSTHGSVLAELKEGISYVKHHPVLKGVILLMVVTGLFGLSFMTLIPAWAVAVLHGDATTNGLLQAARGVGALMTAFWLISLGNFRFKGKLVTIGVFAVPILTVIFSFIRSVPVALGVLVVLGMANLLIANLSTILVQMNADDRLRGRVMGVYTFVFFGFMPLGSLWIGAAADLFSEQTAIIICGVMSLVGAAIIWKLVPELAKAE
jgi:MFS family permease